MTVLVIYGCVRNYLKLSGKNIFFTMVCMGQESRHGLAGSSGSAFLTVSRGLAGKNSLPSSLAGH